MNHNRFIRFNNFLSETRKRFKYLWVIASSSPRLQKLKAGRRVKHGRFFTSRAKDCRRCNLARLCLSGGRTNKAVVLGDDYPALLRARRRREQWSERDKALYTRHRWRVEGIHGEAKIQHGLARAVRRGLINMKIQAYLTAAAINLKRLAAFIAALLCRLVADILNGPDRGTNNCSYAVVAWRHRSTGRRLHQDAGAREGLGRAAAWGLHRHRPMRWLWRVQAYRGAGPKGQSRHARLLLVTCREGLLRRRQGQGPSLLPIPMAKSGENFDIKRSSFRGLDHSRWQLRRIDKENSCLAQKLR
jgi:hypothetical protein